MSEVLESLVSVALYRAGLEAAVPILLAALGGLLCARVGIFNIALEGKLLTGAFVGVAGSWYSGSALVGVLSGVAAGAIVGLVMGFLAVRLRADPIVLGVGANLLAAGATVYALALLFGVQGTFYDEDLQVLSVLGLGPLGDVPVLGDLLAGESPVFYLALLLVPVVAVVLYRTPWGLRVRGVGEHDLAAATLGVPPGRLQIVVLTLAGGLCGLAGAQLSLGDAHQFQQGMSGGRGFIALVAVLLARSNPWGAAAAALGFGLADALGFRLQALSLPPQVVQLVPYLAGLAALVLFRRRVGRQEVVQRV